MAFSRRLRVRLLGATALIAAATVPIVTIPATATGAERTAAGVLRAIPIALPVLYGIVRLAGG